MTNQVCSFTCCNMLSHILWQTPYLYSCGNLKSISWIFWSKFLWKFSSKVRCGQVETLLASSWLINKSFYSIKHPPDSMQILFKKKGKGKYKVNSWGIKLFFSCPGSSLPDLGQSVTEWFSANLEFWHKERLLRPETLQTFDQSDV